MSEVVLLPSLDSLPAIYRVLETETERVVALRFTGDSTASDCIFMDEVLMRTVARVHRFGVVYAVDLRLVPQAAQRFGVQPWRAFSLQFFFRARPLKVDAGTGDTAHLTRPVSSVRQMVDLFEVVYRQAKRGKGLAVAPFRLSTGA
ncbi:hypothetical protein CCYA_CCYA08G2466 [Cyanidiococcus yangmingshanensis]|nr:hypothetical protein CCYA_CCYA08G2466 [Cyanidiococcus yangmingshanensis]